MKFEYDKYVDAKGLKCPQPLLHTKLAIKTMQNDEILLLEATDAHTDLDLEVWCERFGHEIVQTHVENIKNTGNGDEVYQFWIKKRVK